MVATKAEVIGQITQVWSDVEARFAALDDADLDRSLFTQVETVWRVRDLMPHMAFWLRLSARGARRAAEIGKAPDQQTPVRVFLGIDTHFDTLNAESFARWQRRAAADQLAELRAGRDDLLAALAPLPDNLMLVDDEVTGGIRQYIWQPAINHPREHREHLDAALSQKEPSQ